MTDIVLEFAEEQGLGKVLERVSLGGELALPNGGRARAALVLTASGLWLAAARDRFDGLKIDLLTRGDLHFEPGRVRDRLCFARESLQIPTGRRAAVERLIALGRFGARERRHARAVKASRLVHAPDELAQAWLARELALGETLIAWLRAGSTVMVASQLVGEVQVHPYLFVTDRRAAIVAWSSVGDVTYASLDAGIERTQRDGERVSLESGGSKFVSRRADAEAAREASDLLALQEPKSRLLEAARRTWLGREEEKNGNATTLELLHAAIEQQSQRARLARLLVLAEEKPTAGSIDRAELARALAGSRITPENTTELWARWKFSNEAGSVLVRALLELGAQAFPFALALQRRMYDAPTADESQARDELRLTRFAVSQRLDQTRGDRDLALAAVLAPRGLDAAHEGPAPTPPEAGFSPQQIETGLCHPLARGQASLVSGVQRLIALAPSPDQVALNDYCEALDPNAHPEASRALAAARIAFGLPALGAYVSRGKKSLGLRGYEGETPYILLGKFHLDPASPYFMTEAELYFAIGAEALHLKLGQTRVTSNDVWAGAVAHTKGGMELLLGLLPLVKGIPLGPGVSKVLERIPEPALRRALDALIHFEQHRPKAAPPPGNDSALSLVNENLLAAHRLMQMSADRAGLVLCRNLRAALRGLLLTRPDYRDLLEEIAKNNLIDVLLSPTKNQAMQGDLLVRAAALLDFYVSDDYLALSRTLAPQI